MTNPPRVIGFERTGEKRRPTKGELFFYRSSEYVAICNDESTHGDAAEFYDIARPIFAEPAAPAPVPDRVAELEARVAALENPKPIGACCHGGVADQPNPGSILVGPGPDNYGEDAQPTIVEIRQMADALSPAPAETGTVGQRIAAHALRWDKMYQTVSVHRPDGTGVVCRGPKALENEGRAYLAAVIDPALSAPPRQSVTHGELVTALLERLAAPVGHIGAGRIATTLLSRWDITAKGERP